MGLDWRHAAGGVLVIGILLFIAGAVMLGVGIHKSNQRKCEVKKVS